MTQLRQTNVDLRRKLDDGQRKANKLVNFMAKPMIEALEKTLQEFQSEAPLAPIAEVLTISALEVLALWRPRLSGTSLQIFNHLVSLRGRSISRAELAEAVDATLGGSFSARLSEARSTRLLVERGTQVAVNRELLFL